VTRVAIHGAAGRMGLRLVALCCADDALELAAAIDQPGHASSGKDAGTLAGIEPCGVRLSDRLDSQVDVLIDFSVPAACRAAIGQCIETGSNVVIGTTGLTEDDHRAIDEVAATVAVMQAPNMSLGVNVLFALAARVAQQLGDDYDIEIVETHHRFKKDAPSGTALGLAEAICTATGKNIGQALVHGRHGDDVPRQRGQIGVHALRSGDVVGRHTASFATLGEQLELTHIASTRDVFAHGAIRAAKWLVGKPPGRYGMADVLGL